MSNPKYINVHGNLQLNPAWHNPAGPTGTGTTTTVIASAQALPVFSTVDDLMGAQQRAPKPLLQAIEQVQDPHYTSAFGVPEHHQPIDGGLMLDQLSTLFGSLEIPIGLIGHLIELRHFAIHFLVDDSGSMSSDSNLLRNLASPYTAGLIARRNSPYMTRWEEAEDRLHIMFDLLAFVPTKSVTISFMNHRDIIRLDHLGSAPQDYAGLAHIAIRQTFSQLRPTNGTPLFYGMQRMISQAVRSRTPTMHYVLTDGAPGGGVREIQEIERLLQTGRGDPIENPVTFLSCSNQPKDIEWMHESEECSLFVAALHDFQDEQREVYRDQGPAFPYSRGLWLLANLAAARDPDGLDAMDQHSPFTKAVLDNLLGRVHSEGEYRRYFNAHPTNTGGLITGNSSLRHFSNVFQPDYSLFLAAQVEREIPSVTYFQSQLAARLRRDIEEESDINSEARAVQTVERELLRARRNGTFDAANAWLRQTCDTRQQEAVMRVSMAAVANSDGEPSAPPLAEAYVTSDFYTYPARPSMATAIGYPVNSSGPAAAYSAPQGGGASGGNNNVYMKGAYNPPPVIKYTADSPPPTPTIGPMYKIGSNLIFGIFESIRWRDFELISTAHEGTTLTYRYGRTIKGSLRLDADSSVFLDQQGRLSLKTAGRTLVFYGESIQSSQRWLSEINNHISYVRSRPR